MEGTLEFDTSRGVRGGDRLEHVGFCTCTERTFREDVVLVSVTVGISRSCIPSAHGNPWGSALPPASAIKGAVLERWRHSTGHLLEGSLRFMNHVVCSHGLMVHGDALQGFRYREAFMCSQSTCVSGGILVQVRVTKQCH